jgi:hypothetical protein
VIRIVEMLWCLTRLTQDYLFHCGTLKLYTVQKIGDLVKLVEFVQSVSVLHEMLVKIINVTAIG